MYKQTRTLPLELVVAALSFVVWLLESCMASTEK